MENKNIYTLMLGILLVLFTLPYSVSAANCSFALPPNEQIVLNGNQISSRTLVCKVGNTDKGDDSLLSFISEKNISTVNNLILPEGTMMSLSFSPEVHDDFTFKLEPAAKLGITNDTAQFLRLTCNQS